MKTTLNPYIINVTLAAKMCSQVLCQEKGVCTRKHWNSSDYLHLNPKNFAIQTGENGKYTIHGQLTLEDLQQFPQKFYCTCYANTSCKERDNIKNIGAVNVCVTNDICIDGFLNSKPGDQPPGPSSSTPPATASPCVHGKHPKGCSKVRCSGQTISNNAQEGCRRVYRKNSSSRLYIQNKIIKTTPSSTSSVLIKFPVYIVYVLIYFPFLDLIIYLD